MVCKGEVSVGWGGNSDSWKGKMVQTLRPLRRAEEALLRIKGGAWGIKGSGALVFDPYFAIVIAAI